jgi:hypothetical protein
MDFKLQQNDPTGRRAIYQIPTTPSIGRLHVTYAGRTNRGYTDGIGKLATKTGVARRIARGQVDSSTLAQNLSFDRALFPKHVVLGWDGGEDGGPMRDGIGDPVEFNEPNVRDLLNQLPDWIMEDLSHFCALPTHFLPDDMPTEDEFHEQAQD